MSAAGVVAEWYSSVEEGAKTYMSAWKSANAVETNDRHARELFALLPFAPTIPTAAEVRRARENFAHLPFASGP